MTWVSNTTLVLLMATLPANTTYVSVTAPTGWTCAQNAGAITCHLTTGNSLAMGASAGPFAVASATTTVKGPADAPIAKL